MAKKPLEIDMVAGSQLRDTQGEMLSIEGADISEISRFNDNHGKGFFNSLGRVTESKKIFKAEDCENERHKYYWEKVKAPYIYVRGILYDDEDHMNAKAAAAILRNIHKSDCPLKIKASVEGGVVTRGIKDPSLLAQTKIHSVALTFTPANQATLVEPLNLDKSMQDIETDFILIKSVVHLANSNVPSFRDITKAASGIKAGRNLKKIQQLLRKAKQEELDKGLKDMAAGAAMLGSLASPQVAEAKPPKIPKAPQAQVQQKKPITHQQLLEGLKSKNPTLWGIAQIESSGGKNLKHETLDHGQHEGMTAGGPWGIMPKTAAFALKVSPKLRKKYADFAEKAKDIDANHQTFTDSLNKDPKMSYDFANTLYNYLSKHQGGDKHKVLHSWHYGTEGTKRALNKKKDLKTDSYVKSIMDLLHPIPQKVEKALMAGYGGAGAPTSRTGGSVIQTERVGDGKGFQYTACEHCGDEQIYAKHQVKCRKCNKSWSLAHLYKMMVGSK
jgi:hypothetical protein